MFFLTFTLPGSLELIQHRFQFRTVVFLQTPVVLVLLFQDGIFAGEAAILIAEPVIFLLQLVFFAGDPDQVVDYLVILNQQAPDNGFQLLDQRPGFFFFILNYS